MRRSDIRLGSCRGVIWHRTKYEKALGLTNPMKTICSLVLKIIPFGLSAACSGCRATMYFSSVAHCQIDPQYDYSLDGTFPYRSLSADVVQNGVKTNLWHEDEEYFYPCFYCTCGYMKVFEYLGRGGRFALWRYPFPLADTAISLVADTVTMPWQLYRYYSLPEWVRDELREP